MDASGETEFYAGQVQTFDSTDAALIWINQNPAIMNLLADTQELHVNATFKSVPSMFSHLATIHFVAFDNVTAHKKYINLVKNKKYFLLLYRVSLFVGLL